MADVVIVGPGTAAAIKTGIAAAGKGATVVQFTATPPEEEILLRPHDFISTRLVWSRAIHAVPTIPAKHSKRFAAASSAPANWSLISFRSP